MQQVSLGDNGRFGTRQTELFPTEIPEQFSLYCALPPPPLCANILSRQAKTLLRSDLFISGKDATSSIEQDARWAIERVYSLRGKKNIF